MKEEITLKEKDVLIPERNIPKQKLRFRRCTEAFYRKDEKIRSQAAYQETNDQQTGAETSPLEENTEEKVLDDRFSSIDARFIALENPSKSRYKNS